MITIKELAQKAVQQSQNEANWIAVDKNGFVFAFSIKPVIRGDVWDIPTLEDDCWYITEYLRPDDWQTELYEISKILDNE